MPKKPKKSNKLMLSLFTSLLVLLVAAAVLAVYFFVLREPSTEEVYRNAVKNALTTSKTEKPYISIDLQSDGFNVNGQASSDLSNDNGQAQMDFDAEVSSGGIMLDIKGEIINITKKGVDESYMRYKTVSTDNAEYSELMESYFEPTLNKWVKSSKSDDDNESANFRTQGPTAVISALGLFIPISSYTEKEVDAYLAAVEKYNLYQVSEKFEKTTFKGIDARKVRIDIKKDSLVEFDKELSQVITDEDKFRKTDISFINDLFGPTKQISADVYLDPKDAMIVGVDFSVDLKDEIVNKSFGSKFDSVSVSALVEYDREFTVKAPKKFITEKQFEALLAQ